ncbi:MAG: SufE family protein [Cytophagia bacterium]|nr:MAG: SufE family protein [Cytophagia bacterium]TAG43180.1 MAG: SufE family protein [Cytophagia bacterium]TAH28789.1 MAG: SufE family protein [Cytophagales bacterium]
MTINEIQNQIIDDFSLFDNWEDKYAYLIELGKKLPTISDEYKTDTYKIKGCQSNVWVKSNKMNDKIVFEGDSDAVIVKGLVSLLLAVLSHQTPSEIVEAELYFIEKIGMTQNLSMTRANGFASMIKQMRMDAMAYQNQ